MLEGQANLVELRNTLEQVRQEEATTQGLSTRLIEVVESSQDELATFEQQTIAQREHLNKLQADLRSLEEGTKRLSGGMPSERGARRQGPRAFVGDGDRQYLTGLKVGGKRILLLVDGSASMLADTVVNAVRRAASCPRPTASAPTSGGERCGRPTGSPPSSRATRSSSSTSSTPRPAAPARHRGHVARRPRPQVAGQRGGGLRSTAPAGGTSLENAFAAAFAALRPPARQHPAAHRRPAHPGQTPPPGTARSRAGSGCKLFERAVKVAAPRVSP